MDNLNLVLLSGGYHHCTSGWNAKPYGKDSCYKLYFPVEGNAQICVNETWYDLLAGNVYFINGFKLDKNRCAEYMNVYWVHFIPESQLLNMYLNKLNPVYSWGNNYAEKSCADFKQIPELFENPYQKENQPSKLASFSKICNINALILKLVSDMIEKQQVELSDLSYDLYYKLEAAVDFIDGNYNKGLKLEQIAQKVYLNPSYFLRLFKKCFKMTPNEYITMKKLNEACRLLTRTNMPIREIADNTGFCNQFYFSKVFRSFYHKTPLEYRSKRLSP